MASFRTEAVSRTGEAIAFVESDGLFQDRGGFQDHALKAQPASLGQGVVEQAQAVSANDRTVRVFEDAECPASGEVGLLDVTEIGVGAAGVGLESVLLKHGENQLPDRVAVGVGRFSQLRPCVHIRNPNRNHKMTKQGRLCRQLSPKAIPQF